MPKSHQTPLDRQLDAKVYQLRKLLMTANDLGEVCDYFHRVLVADDAFIASGSWSYNQRLATALELALQRVAPGGKLCTPLLTIRLPHQALCHGYSTWGGGHLVFLYFEQHDLGFCSYSPNLISAEV